MAAEAAVPRKRPCASCPYRQNVPSGVWHPEEYLKLPEYDGEIHEQVQHEQALKEFHCHQGDGTVCSGWLGHREPTDLLAVRLGIARGSLDPSCATYTTEVPLFPSGRAAAEHGMREVEAPSDEAVEVIEKISRKRDLAFDPVVQQHNANVARAAHSRPPGF